MEKAFGLSWKVVFMENVWISPETCLIHFDSCAARQVQPPPILLVVPRTVRLGWLG